jgi:vacuolar-type H+-ATPase subunit F/Vma7
MANIAFIGKERILRVCQFLGTSVFLVETSAEAESKLQELLEDSDNPWGIIYIEENLAEAFLGKVIEVNKGELPVISLFPSVGEKKELSAKILGDLVHKVTGVDLQFD